MIPPWLSIFSIWVNDLSSLLYNTSKLFRQSRRFKPKISTSMISETPHTSAEKHWHSRSLDRKIHRQRCISSNFLSADSTLPDSALFLVYPQLCVETTLLCSQALRLGLSATYDKRNVSLSILLVFKLTNSHLTLYWTPQIHNERLYCRVISWTTHGLELPSRYHDTTTSSRCLFSYIGHAGYGTASYRSPTIWEYFRPRYRPK